MGRGGVMLLDGIILDVKNEVSNNLSCRSI